MTARDRRQRMYQQIGQAKQADPQVIARRANDAVTIARQAFRSSRIEGCKVNLDQLRETAEGIAKTRK